MWIGMFSLVQQYLSSLLLARLRRFLSNIDIKDLVYVLNLEYESDLPNVWAFMD